MLNQVQHDIDFEYKMSNFK